VNMLTVHLTYELWVNSGDPGFTKMDLRDNRGLNCTRSPIGNARAAELFAAVTVKARPEVKAEGKPPRSHDDYLITISDDLPEGDTVEKWVRPRSSARPASNASPELDGLLTL
jgi:hypothetical protein